MGILFWIKKPIYIAAELKITQHTLNVENQTLDCRVLLTWNKKEWEATKLTHQIQKIQTPDAIQGFWYQKENFEIYTAKSLEMIAQKPNCNNSSFPLLLKVGWEPILIYLIKIIFPL